MKYKELIKKIYDKNNNLIDSLISLSEKVDKSYPVDVSDELGFIISAIDNLNRIISKEQDYQHKIN